MNAKGRFNTVLHAEQSHNKSGGGSFGIAASERACNKYLVKDTPGPGEYDVRMTAQGRLDTVEHAGHSHNKTGGGSFGLATSERQCNKMPVKETPGPGEYEVKMTAQGRMDTVDHANHSHNKSGGGSFGMATSERQCNKMPVKDTPGPGEYEVKRSAEGRLDTVEHASHSHNKSGGGSFGQATSERQCNKVVVKDTPGPGEYEVKMTAQARLDTVHHAHHSHNKSGGGSFGLATSERQCNKLPVKDTPGPGEYEVKTTAAGRLDTVHHASHSHNKSGGGSFGLATSERSCNMYPRSDSPAPGEYEVKASAQGRLDTADHASQSHNKSGGGSFGLASSDRPCNKMLVKDTPGPGEYEVNMNSTGRLNTVLHAQQSHNKSGGGSFGLATSERPCNRYPSSETPAPGDFVVNVTARGRKDVALHAQ